MPLVDLTAELMGDPSASYRRAPTQEEMDRSVHKLTWDYALRPDSNREPGKYRTKNPSVLRGLSIGQYVVKQSKSSADHAIRNLRNYGFNGIRKKLESGEYLVIRTK